MAKTPESSLSATAGRPRRIGGICPQTHEITDSPPSGMTSHTLRHSAGPFSGLITTPIGEALAITGAILGRANMRSTMTYDLVEMKPSKRTAGRIGEQLGAALWTRLRSN
jgi:hypothetical protein